MKGVLYVYCGLYYTGLWDLTVLQKICNTLNKHLGKDDDCDRSEEKESESSRKGSQSHLQEH